jgi:hypothetical protein
MRLIGFSAMDGNQWHPQIAHFPEQSVQRSLINDWAG